MNLPSSLKTLTTKQYQLTAKQRLIVIAAVGIMTLMIVVYVTSSEVADEPIQPMNNAQTTAAISSKPVIAKGSQMIAVNQVEETMRDPFARLPEGKEQKNDADRGLPVIQNNVPSYVPSMVPKTIAPSNLRLTGIVGNAERRLAVIMTANKSQSYSLNDMIGAYQITTINKDYVVLTNTDSKLVLHVEAAGQKGGNTNEK